MRETMRIIPSHRNPDKSKFFIHLQILLATGNILLTVT